MTCYLAEFSGAPCEGRMDRCHLIPQQLLRREKLGHECPNPATWVPACRKHHKMLDESRKLRVPFHKLPVALMAFCAEHELSWWLEREYGKTGDRAQLDREKYHGGPNGSQTASAGPIGIEGADGFTYCVGCHWCCA